jgi:hypothetical protein
MNHEGLSAAEPGPRREITNQTNYTNEAREKPWIARTSADKDKRLQEGIAKTRKCESTKSDWIWRAIGG